MTFKARFVNLYPDEFIAGVASKLTLEEFGLYTMICFKIYSAGGPITDTADDLAGLFKKCNPRTIRAVLESLVTKAKVQRNDAELMVNRCRTELEKALKRTQTNVENGSKGGRPSTKNNDLDKPNGFTEQKHTRGKTINHQPKNQIEGGGGSAPATEPAQNGGTVPQPTEADADKIVLGFERLRDELWPKTSLLPSPRTTLRGQATGFLKDGGTVELILGVVEKGMRKAQSDGKSPTNNLRAFHLSITDAIASHRAGNQNSGGRNATSTGSATGRGVASDDQRRNAIAETFSDVLEPERTSS